MYTFIHCLTPIVQKEAKLFSQYVINLKYDPLLNFNVVKLIDFANLFALKGLNTIPKLILLRVIWKSNFIYLFFGCTHPFLPFLVMHLKKT